MYYTWRAWRLRGGLPADRPAILPRLIFPATLAIWYTRLAVYRALHPPIVVPPLGPVSRGLTAFFDNPAGGIEDALMMWNSGGLRSWFTNQAKISWDVIEARAVALGGDVIPWQRCYNKEDVEGLIIHALARDRAGVAINYEPSGPDTVLTVEEILDAISTLLPKTFPVYIVVSPWMENDPPWYKLGSRCVFIIEAFTNVVPYKIAELLEHAHKLGAHQVTLMAGLYPAANTPPASLAAWQQAGGAPIIYLGDNLGNDPSAWAKWKPIGA